MGNQKRCRLCRSSALRTFYNISDVYLGDHFAASPSESLNSPCADVSVFVCERCFHVQQPDVVKPDLVWKKYTYRSGMALGMKAHLQDLKQSISKFMQGVVPSAVLDIGSNDGTFLSLFDAQRSRVLGVDPAPQIGMQANERGIPTISGLWGKAQASAVINLIGKPDLITAFNVFGHMEDLEDFIAGVSMCLGPEGVFVFECQYLLDVIDKTLAPTFFHEHVSHHHLLALDNFFSRFGLELADAFHADIQNGAVVGFVRWRASLPKTSRLTRLIEIERVFQETLLEEGLFERNVARTIEKIERSLEAHARAIGKTRSDLVIVGFGASRSASVIMRLIPILGKAYCIFDENQRINGFFYPGSRLRITDDLKVLDSADIIINLAWSHAEPIVERLIEQFGGERKLILNPFPYIDNFCEV